MRLNKNFSQWWRGSFFFHLLSLVLLILLDLSTPSSFSYFLNFLADLAALLMFGVASLVEASLAATLVAI